MRGFVYLKRRQQRHSDSVENYDSAMLRTKSTVHEYTNKIWSWVRALKNTNIHSRLLRVKTRSLHDYNLQRRFVWWDMNLLKFSLTCFTWQQSTRTSLWSALLALDVQWSRKAESIAERVTAIFKILWQFTHIEDSQRKMMNHAFFILRFWWWKVSREWNLSILLS